MRYLGLEQSSKPQSKAVQVRPQVNNALAQNDTKNLAGNLKSELNLKIAERNSILAQLVQTQNSKSSISEQDQCRNFRNQIKEIHNQANIDPEQVQELKTNYNKFVVENKLAEKPYLKSFTSFMDGQIQELEAKTKVEYTPKQAFAMYETKNQALAVIDMVGPELNLDKLNTSELSKMSKTVSKMKEGFSMQATKLFPELKPDFAKIEAQVSQGYDPEKAKLSFEFAKMPLKMANQIVDITTGKAQSPVQAKLDLKSTMKDYFERVSSLDADLKKRSVGATDAD